MNDTEKLLCFIYKNAEMGCRTLPQIIRRAQGEDAESGSMRRNMDAQAHTMGVDTSASSMLSDSSDRQDDFVQALRNRERKYQEICHEAESLLRSAQPEFDREELGQSFWEKTMTDGALYMNTLRDVSCSHLSHLLLKGSSMGVTDIAKQMAKHPNASEDAMRLGEKLLKVEQDGIEEMEGYLTAL